MSSDKDDEPDFGTLLAQARDRAGMSTREAARRAGFSEGLWRQMENGYKSVGGGLTVPTNPRPRNVIAAARAVGLDVVPALEAAGHQREADRQRALAEEQPVLSVVRSMVEQPDDEEDNEVLAAVRRDPYLDDDARQHYLNQYHLLREMSAARKAARERGDRMPYVARGKPKTPVGHEKQSELEEIVRRTMADRELEGEVPPE